MHKLRQRSDFLAAAHGAKAPARAFVLQARTREDPGPARVGFTVTRKVGTAVERNRVRRRLRAILRASGDERLRPGVDYVVIGRRAALEMPFDRFVQDFLGALARVHRVRRAAGEPVREPAPDLAAPTPLSDTPPSSRASHE
jgi:ribonuclease P protein component